MDYGVIGISGIDNDGSLLDFDYHEVKIAQAIIPFPPGVPGRRPHQVRRNAMVNLGNLSPDPRPVHGSGAAGELMRLMSQHQIACHIC